MEGIKTNQGGIFHGTTEGKRIYVPREPSKKNGKGKSQV